MLNRILLIVPIILITISCNSDKWKRIEILSPDKGDTISVITIENNRYIFNGNSNKIPINNYALLSTKNVTELGDEIGICWNKYGYKWKLNSFDSEIISNNLDSSKYVVEGKKFDENGIPDHKEYFNDGCVVVYPRGEIIRPKNGAILIYK